MNHSPDMKFFLVIDDHQMELGYNSVYSFPNENYNLSLDLSPFWQVRIQLLVDGDLLLVGPPLVIPSFLFTPGGASSAPPDASRSNKNLPSSPAVRLLALQPFGKYLFLYRNAPINEGASTSQILFNRSTRDIIPTQRHSFAPGL